MKIPADRKDVELEVDGRRVKLTNLDKEFWPSPKITKSGRFTLEKLL